MLGDVRELGFAIGVALCVAGCVQPAQDEPVPPPGFAWGAEVVCDQPLSGWDRFREEGVARGLTEPMEDPTELYGNLVLGRGGGLAVEDLDADGDLDVVAMQVGGVPDVYLNGGDARFERVEAAVPDGIHQGPVGALADLDGDGLPELLLDGGSHVSAYLNVGGGRFGEPVDVFSPTLLQSGAILLTFSLGDVDGDGDLDLAVPRLLAGPGGGTMDPFNEGAPDLVLRNEGQLARWTEAGALVSEGSGGISQVAVFTDRDGDGDADLFVPNDMGPPSAFWRNDGAPGGVPILVNDAAAIGADVDMAAMGIDHADLNGDGLLDYCMADLGPPRCLLSDGSGGYFEGGAALGLEPAAPAGSPTTVGWGFVFADLDGDGRLDAAQASGPEEGTHAHGLTELMDLLWAGTDDGFVDVSVEAGFDDVIDDYGLVAADLDDDGYPELLVAGPGRPPRLFMNGCGAGAWLEVELIGSVGNRDALGARIEVEVAGDPARIRELWSLRGQSQSPSRAHFGLGDAEEVATLTVRWPDGRVSRAEGVPVRRRVTVDHAAAAPVDPGDDDDAVQSDDDDATEPLTPGEGEILVEGLVMVPGEPPGEGDALDGVPVFSSHDPGAVSLTRPDGSYDLVVPEDAEVRVQVEHDALIPLLAPIQTAWQTHPQAGLAHPLFTPAAWTGVVEAMTGAPPDPERGALWVAVVGGGGQSVTGAAVEVDRPYDAVVALGQADPAPGNVLTPGTSTLLFARVEPGAAVLTVTPPGAEQCVGPSDVEVVAGALVQVTFRCQ